MKILAINGSPRKNGRTSELLETVLASAEKQGAQTCLIHLADYHIWHCRGCYTCIKSSCPQQDDMLRLLTDIRICQADALVYGAPVFNFNLPGLLIDFWNRKTALKHINFSLLGECDRVLTGMAAHTRQWDKALEDADRLGKKLIKELEKNKGPYPLWQMPVIYKRLTCFEFPRS